MYDDYVSCLKRLKYLYDQIEKITDLFKNRRRLFGADRELAQQLLKWLKDEIKSDYKNMSKVTYENTMSDIEKEFYFPTIHEIFTIIRVKTNSIPDTNWLNQLFEAQEELHYIIPQLENELK